jgi:hypothetical protein
MFYEPGWVLLYSIQEAYGGIVMKLLPIMLVCLLLFVASCATVVPAPTDEKDSLVIGELILKASGFESYGGSTVNGIHPDSVLLTIRNTSSKVDHKVSTHGPDGFFFVAGLPRGDYAIVKLYFRSQGNNGSWSDVTLPLGQGVRFHVRDGAASNLGKLHAFAVGEEPTEIRQEGNWDEVQLSFQKLHPDSPWNHFEWRIAQN